MGLARCPSHGLLFDPTASAGCSRCRQSDGPRLPRRGFLVAAGAAAFGAGAVALSEALPRRVSAQAPTPNADILDLPYDGQRRGILLEPLSAYRARPNPLILLYNPGGDARGIVARYAPAARDRGWAVASAFDVANGTPDEADTASMMALLGAIRRRMPLDPERIYAGGFSGGACGAYRLAIVRPEVVRGAVVECGHMGSWREVGEKAQASSRFFLFTRANDFNCPATRQLREAMSARGCRVVEVERAGGHMPMGPDEVGLAPDWLDRA